MKTLWSAASVHISCSSLQYADGTDIFDRRNSESTAVGEKKEKRERCAATDKVAEGSHVTST